MALKTINDLTALTTPASTDLVGVWAVGAARMRKSTIAQTFSPMLAVANVFSDKQTMDALVALKKNVAPGTTSGYLELGTDSNGDLKVQNDAGAERTLAGSISGGGTVATGGYALTVPASGTAALLGTANVFTAGQTISPASDVVGLIINSVANPTANHLSLQKNGSERIYALAASTTSRIALVDTDLGNASTGAFIQIGRNNNSGTLAPGSLYLTQANGGGGSVYFDDSGILRKLATDFPVSTNFASGDVIGAQTSHASYKSVVGAPVDDVDALQFICAAATQVARFVYKSGAYGRQEFSGLVLDGNELDRYGQDADAEHVAGKSLNVINAIGDLFLAVRHLANRISVLELATE